MKRLSLLFNLLLLTLIFSCQSGDKTDSGPDASASSATPMEDDWIVLFDGGSDLDATWHSYLKDKVVGWMVEDGLLTMEGGGGDLVTDRTFDDFELTADWKISEKGNSGIIYLVDEDPKYSETYLTGPEYQLLDDAGYADQDLKPSQMTGSNYDMHAPSKDVTRPAGQWNTSTIKVEDGYVEHWLNGAKVVEYEIGSESWQTHVAASKWKDEPGYGTITDGHIALQDHGHPIWFRSIKIREL